MTVLEQMTTPVDEAPEVTAKVARLMVYTNFNLQGIASKVDTIKSNPLCSGKWVVFVNRAGTLARCAGCACGGNDEQTKM